MSPKFRLVCATRETEQQFAAKTALGRSLALFPYPFVELRLFPANSSGLPTLCNTALREAAADPAILVFLHDDVHLLDFFWPNHIYEGLRAFDVVGIAGNKRRVVAQPAWRFVDDRLTRDDKENLSGIVAHGSEWPPRHLSYYGPPYQQVKLLDGVLLASASETLLSRNLFFDPRFDFHFYDLDFCRQAEFKNLRLGTCSVSCLLPATGSSAAQNGGQPMQNILKNGSPEPDRPLPGRRRVTGRSGPLSSLKHHGVLFIHSCP